MNNNDNNSDSDSDNDSAPSGASVGGGGGISSMTGTNMDSGAHSGSARGDSDQSSSQQAKAAENAAQEARDSEAEYDTEVGKQELDNLTSKAKHTLQASVDWQEGDYLGWAGEKIGGLVDSAQAYGYEQARGLTQAPMDYMADVARNSFTQSLAMVAAGPVGLVGSVGLGLADRVMDYTQGEAGLEDSLKGGLSDIMSFAPYGVKQVYDMANDPVKFASKIATTGIKTGMPLVDKMVGMGAEYALNHVQDSIMNGAPVNSETGQYLSSTNQFRQSAQQRSDQQQQSNINRGLQQQFYNPELIIKQPQLGNASQFADLMSIFRTS